MNDCEWEAAIALHFAASALMTLLLACWSTTAAVVFVVGSAVVAASRFWHIRPGTHQAYKHEHP